MGVPKFFRWMSERYANLSVNVENNQIPDFDCLYLDMNGIIHICSHPDDANVLFRITEEQIFSNVFKYIDFLFKTVKPKEVFFLAVDGVAPRAKMNQQRSRRFKSAKEAKDRDTSAVQSGVILPNEKRFDSNAITPGTEFMDRLQQALKAYLADKITSDNLWHGVDVILSGHNTPGEGEHKIQEYIRYRRSLPDYNPNTRHCLYGLDADLMLLGLASHEPYFSLLREEVTFSPKNKGKRAYIAEETKFFLLHLSLLRDYIDYEFSSLRVILGQEYDLERIIDDWIIMTFLVGNDFVPHLPNLHIHTSALPLLWQTYIKIRPTMNGYINENGRLNIKNLMTFITDFAQFDYKNFEDMFEDMKWMFGKRGEKMAKELDDLDKKAKNHYVDPIVDQHVCNNNANSASDKDLIDFFEVEVRSDEVVEDLKDEMMVDNIEQELIDDVGLLNLGGLVDEGDDGNDVWQMQFSTHKAEYYYNKLGLTYSPEMAMQQAKEYITALQWISYYYFCGVPSWSWFYPQHYAPFVSDLVHLSKDIVEDGIAFDISRPFLPFEQLMAVLPADSSDLLPDCFSVLMTMENSSIVDFYPRTFKSDLNGKKRDWEALVLIPFIDERRLLSALEAHKNLLSDEEVSRNVHGPHIKYRFSQKCLDMSDIDPELFRVPRDSLVFGLCPNVQLDVICQGFPTFKHIEHTFVLEKAFVRVFENHSTSESIVLKITPPSEAPTSEEVARSHLGKLVFVNWPAFLLTKVVSVLDKKNRISLDPETQEVVITALDQFESKKIAEYVASQPQELYKRRAVSLDLGSMLVLETQHSEGHVYEIASVHKAGCSVKLERNWVTTKTHWHLHQLSVLQESIETVMRAEVKVCTKLSQLFPLDGLVFCLDSRFYGHSGRIRAINNVKGSIVVGIEPQTEPNYTDVSVHDVGLEYMSTAQASECLGMDALQFSRITGSIFIAATSAADPRNKQQRHGKKDRHSIGLDLKNNKLNLQIPGWTVKVHGENGKWLYSMLVVRVLADYRDKFPEVFQFITLPNFETLTMEHLFGIEGDKRALEAKSDELRRYLDSLEYKTVEKLSNAHQLLSESQISILQQYTEHPEDLARTEVIKEVELPFKELYRPHFSLGGTKADLSTEYRLLDRVVCSTEGYTVPLGLHGVVIGIEPLANDQIKLEVLFDQEFSAAISIRASRPRCYRMPPHALINMTHGARKHTKAPLDVADRAAANASNSICTPKPPCDEAPLCSEILTALLSSSATHLPPMPSKKYSEMASDKGPVVVHGPKNGQVDKKSTPKEPARHKHTQMDFIHHCDDVYKSSAPPVHRHTTVINRHNYPPEYELLFGMCLKCGVPNPVVLERYEGDSISMSFKCDYLEMPEMMVPDLQQGRDHHIHRVWCALYSMQQQWAHVQYEPHYVPPQFQDNPFMQVYPSQTSHNHTTPRRESRTTVSMSANGGERDHARGTDQSGVAKTQKPFIKAPKSHITFPK